MIKVHKDRNKTHDGIRRSLSLSQIAEGAIRLSLMNGPWADCPVCPLTAKTRIQQLFLCSSPGHP